jgi:LPS export ABC transporter protein LptC
MRKLLLAALAVLAACSPRVPPPHATPAPAHGRRSHGPWLHITGRGTARRPVRWVWKADNRTVYDLVARSFESNGAQGNAVTTFFDASVTFYGTRGNRLVATASQAIVDQATNTITLVGNVRARNGTGMTLTCDTLRYDRGTEMLHGQGNVVMTDPHGMRATGDSVDADLTLSKATMR